MASGNTCKECGSPFTAKRSTKRFCSTPCRQAFNNRRMERGAELYDMFMTLRYERDKARELQVWTLMCRMAQQMRDEDFKDRAGRKSWQPAGVVLADRPDLHAVTITNNAVGAKRR